MQMTRSVRPREVRGVALAMLALTMIAGSFTVATPVSATTCTLPAVFTDVPTSHPFCEEIRFIHELGAMAGYPDGTFRPVVPMTRQAVAGTLYNLIYVDQLPPGPHPCEAGTFMPFTDVPLSHPFCTQIAALLHDQVIMGFPDATFRPADTVTRQATSHWMAYVQAAGEPDYDPCLVPPFPDVPISHPFCPQIQYLKVSGVANGYADGGFHPGTTQSRQAFAAFAYRVYF